MGYRNIRVFSERPDDGGYPHPVCSWFRDGVSFSVWSKSPSWTVSDMLDVTKGFTPSEATPVITVGNYRMALDSTFPFVGETVQECVSLQKAIPADRLALNGYLEAVRSGAPDAPCVFEGPKWPLPIPPISVDRLKRMGEYLRNKWAKDDQEPDAPHIVGG